MEAIQPAGYWRLEYYVVKRTEFTEFLLQLSACRNILYREVKFELQIAFSGVNWLVLWEIIYLFFSRVCLTCSTVNVNWWMVHCLCKPFIYLTHVTRDNEQGINGDIYSTYLLTHIIMVNRGMFTTHFSFFSKEISMRRKV